MILKINLISFFENLNIAAQRYKVHRRHNSNNLYGRRQKSIHLLVFYLYFCIKTKWRKCDVSTFLFRMSSQKVVFKYDLIAKQYLKLTIETDFYRSLLAKEADGQTFSHGDIRANVADLMIRHRGEKESM